MALEKQEFIREKRRMVDIMLGVIPVGQLDIARVVNKPGIWIYSWEAMREIRWSG